MLPKENKQTGGRPKEKEEGKTEGKTDRREANM
jgi:hypothetical protein